ncbi:lysosomal Pro-X carboxypeptidase-like [Iris pallida]|uniref:Lysosomal Pro-X carboxypeptidase-like n=1 Tax=Iris pallida TaxID=29817 RepID=A0AAX6ILC1_IRIPA|nr:lysosomal Pro-X carboxypeptidase-like [Iris pallida]
MKPLFLLLIFFSASSASAAKFSYRFPASAHVLEETRNSINSGKVAYKIGYYMQSLDHFNYQPSGNGKFRQKYLVDDRHWAGGPSAPIFVYCGNEADIEWFANNTGFMFDVAPDFKALLLFIEHRYYGESIPFGGDKDVAFANATTLGYLSTTQALADYATLITDLKKNLSSEQSPVVVLGGSYGGMLAAWFRLKYPHVAIGALASSAPILNFLDLASPYTFNNIITNDFKGTSENCYNVIKNSWKEIEEVVGTKEGIKKLGESFKICNGDGWGQFLAEFIEDWLQYALAYVAMTDYPTPSDFLNPLPAYPVKEICRAIDNPTTGNDTFARMYGVMNVYYNQSGRAGKCFDLAQDLGNPAIGQSQWSWQSCTELILPTGGNNNESIFPASTYNFTDEANTCQLRYGIPPRPHWLETEFGGHDIRRALKRFGSNIIFFNGLRDPWSGGGVLKSISKSIIAIVAPEGAHHVDLRFATKDDPAWLQKVRRREMQIIQQWLDQYYNDLK